MKKFILLITALFIVSPHLFADERSIDRAWLGLFGKKALWSDYSMWSEVQARMDNDRFHNQQLLFRWGPLKQIDEKNEIGLLYGYILTDRLREHRPTLQYTRTFKSNEQMSFSLRNRLEYRIWEDIETESLRYRAAFRYQHNLTGGKSLIAWEEPFLNITSEERSGKRIFERNRFFAGVGLSVDKTRFEIGYMNQYTPRTDRDIIEHIATIYFFY